MIGYLLKNWKLLLDLILVVGGIIALAIFDPFGMFSRAKLKNTANLVSSVREIGELTTAEYYGEVVSSLHETIIYNVPADSLYDAFEQCYIDMRRAVADTLNERKRIRTRHWNDIKKSQGITDVIANYNTPDADSVYSSLLVFLAVNHLSGEDKDFYNFRQTELRNKTERRVFQFLTDQFAAYRKSLNKDPEDISEEDLDRFILDLPDNFTTITDFHFELRKDSRFSTRKLRKQDIVFIGRGWVKAGFRFGQLDESNFYYDKRDKVIQFYGLMPTILDKDINPWFIPEEKIKGFDLVNYYSGATFEESKEVKKKCKEKLLEQAKNADILHSAMENGKDALQTFFSLLLDEPDLRVEMLEFPFALEYEMIAADTLVTVEEALIVDRLYDQTISDTTNLTLAEINRKLNAFQLFLNKLKKLAFVEEQFRFSLLSTEAARILNHEAFVTQSDYDSIKEIRQALERNDGKPETDYMRESMLYTDYDVFTTDFNKMLEVIDTVLSRSAFLREDTLFLTKSQARKRSIDLDTTYYKIDSISQNEDKIYKILYKDDYQKPPVFMNLQYPVIELNPEEFEEITLFSLDGVDKIINENKSKAIPNLGDEQMYVVFRQDLDSIAAYKIDSIKTSIMLDPIHNVSSGLKKLIQ